MGNNDNKGITRRETIKKIGNAAAGIWLGVITTNVYGILSDTYNLRNMKVLLINGSPNKEGCTFTALSEVAKALNGSNVETDMFWIGRGAMISCIGCGACSKSGRCFQNDRVNEFLESAGGFDGFVFGSPVHFAAMNGALTSFMDRVFFAARSTGIMYGKPFASVTSSRRSGSITTLDQLNKYPIHGGMPVVPSQYWPMVFGNTPDEVFQDAEGLQIMRTLGRNMAWMLRCIEAGKQLGINYPEREPRIGTNFIR